MKVRFHFKRVGKGNAVPVYHQNLVANQIKSWVRDAFQNSLESEFDLYTFSSLKGLNKCESNLLFFHTNQVHIMLSSPHEEWLRKLADYIMSRPEFQIHEMTLVPESYETAYAPRMEWETRYVSMSPMVLFDPKLFPQGPAEILNPYSAQFSDLLYETLMDKMENFSLKTFDFNAYSKFQIVPDARYIEKLKVNKKKLGRILDVGGTKVKAYLFPFTLYAHPDVQNFVYDAGIGALGNEGFGCLDLVLPGKKI